MKSGSYTVEAALVLPLCFAIIFGLMYEGFLLHDRTVLHHWVSFYADSLCMKEPETKDTDAQKISAEAENGCFFITNVSLRKEERNEKIVVQYDAECPVAAWFPLGGMFSYAAPLEGTVIREKNPNPATFLYTVRAIKRKFSQ